jgi:glycine/serine hydroxymethyltransferase
MREIADIMGQVLRNVGDEGVKNACRTRVAELTARFPAYPG